MIIDEVNGRRRLLSYCTNVHPGESVDEIREALARWAVPLRLRFEADEPFALGLRLGEAAVAELDSDEETLEAFRGFLDEHRFMAYTLNVFPQGAFHADIVKTDVYLPDWSDRSRARYTVAAARVLASLLPEDEAHGSMSTLPLGWVDGKESASASSLADRGARMIAGVAHELSVLEAETGKRIQLCLEPEPLCAIETTGEAIQWFRDSLWPRACDLPRVDGADGEAQLRRHVGVCFDACHHAVEHEDVCHSLERLEGAGIDVGKIQLSCALELVRPHDNPAGLARLMTFDEPRFLHQVIARTTGGQMLRFEDLRAFAARVERGGEPIEVARCHFHVPIHADVEGPLQTTRPSLTDLLAREARGCSSHHLEVETYTFDVMPDSSGRERCVVESLERELRFARAGLVDAPRG